MKMRLRVRGGGRDPAAEASSVESGVSRQPRTRLVTHVRDIVIGVELAYTTQVVGVTEGVGPDRIWEVFEGVDVKMELILQLFEPQYLNQFPSSGSSTYYIASTELLATHSLVSALQHPAARGVCR